MLFLSASSRVACTRTSMRRSLIQIRKQIETACLKWMFPAPKRITRKSSKRFLAYFLVQLDSIGRHDDSNNNDNMPDLLTRNSRPKSLLLTAGKFFSFDVQVFIDSGCQHVIATSRHVNSNSPAFRGSHDFSANPPLHRPVLDVTARAFTERFYGALFVGKCLGCLQLILQGNHLGSGSRWTIDPN